jgi:hypothetical protein
MTFVNADHPKRSRPRLFEHVAVADHVIDHDADHVDVDV